jgi:CRISPR-associated protein Cmr2
MPINRFHFKLYALLRETAKYGQPIDPSRFACLQPHLETLQAWWEDRGHLAAQIGNASDRLYFQSADTDLPPAKTRHLISGQDKAIDCSVPLPEIPAAIYSAQVETVFLWFWRCYPELQSRQSRDALLLPCDRLLPDCPRHSYLSTASAIAGALAPLTTTATTPYLLLFTFSPVQEFIKASRKFLDFWSGSYMLHYLSAQLCWHIAEQQGADAVITPALWGQEIIDALIVHHNPAFASYLPNGTPQNRFQAKQSSSLSTAGFPNVITALVSSRDEANQLGQSLQAHLKDIWYGISLKVRQQIKDQVIKTLTPAVVNEFVAEFGEPVRAELNKYLQPGCWEWNKLWNAQIQQTWETYFVAVPLGHPQATLDRPGRDPAWIDLQDTIAQPRSRPDSKLLTDAELQAYTRFNVGTWWGSLQARLGQLTQAVKNTRN